MKKRSGRKEVKKAVICVAVAAVVAFATLAAVYMPSVKAEKSKREQDIPEESAASEEETTEQEPQTPTEEETEPTEEYYIHEIPDLKELNESPYHTNPVPVYCYRESSTLKGWWHYEIPEEYAQNGGALPDCVQVYTHMLCQYYNMDYNIVLAIIEVESGYKWNAKSEKGAVGYMQIMEEYHKQRALRLNKDLQDPHGNIRTAIDYLAELKSKYDTPEKVLTAYHYGESGAKEHIWDKGLTTCEYADRVIEISERIEKQLKEREQQINGK